MTYTPDDMITDFQCCLELSDSIQAYTYCMRMASNNRRDNAHFGSLCESLVCYVFGLNKCARDNKIRGDAVNKCGTVIEIKSSAPHSAGYRIGKVRESDKVLLIQFLSRDNQVEFYLVRNVYSFAKTYLRAEGTAEDGVNLYGIRSMSTRQYDRIQKYRVTLDYLYHNLESLSIATE